MAFKGKMRFYASEFRRVSEGGAAFAQSVTDDMMNLADRLGSEYDDVDPKAWKHLLVYTPQPTKPAEPLTDEELALDLLEIMFVSYENGVSCYEDPENGEGYVGQAFRLDDETFHACADLLNRRRPRANGIGGRV